MNVWWASLFFLALSLFFFILTKPLDEDETPWKVVGFACLLSFVAALVSVLIGLFGLAFL